MPSLLATMLCLLLLVSMPGCGEPYQVAEVEGVLLLNGKPGNKIYLQFIPEPGENVKAPISTATTDAAGRFTLQLEEKSGKTRPGAVVGMHRVVLSDLQLAESATGRGVPIRLEQSWLMPGTTPLKQEIKAGKQTLELKYP